MVLFQLCPVPLGLRLSGVGVGISFLKQLPCVFFFGAHVLVSPKQLLVRQALLLLILQPLEGSEGLRGIADCLGEDGFRHFATANGLLVFLQFCLGRSISLAESLFRKSRLRVGIPALRAIRCDAERIFRSTSCNVVRVDRLRAALEAVVVKFVAVGRAPKLVGVLLDAVRLAIAVLVLDPASRRVARAPMVALTVRPCSVFLRS